MHSRRFASLLLGVWLAGGLIVALVARENRRVADRLIEPPRTAILLQFKSADIPGVRLLLRYEAAEQTRSYYEGWETMQILLGTFFFFFLLFGTREDKYSLLIPLLMLSVTIGQRFVLTPEITGRGRVLDFVPEGALAADRVKLLVLQKAYWAAEVGKGALGLLLAARLILLVRRRPSGADIRNQLDLVDKANYGHIDR